MGQERPSKDPDAIRALVQDGYTRIVERASGCCGSLPHAEEVGRKIGYSEAQLREVPDGANLGVGCGNPTAIDALRPGEVVVDLGSGAGMDAFLAARQVGPTGHVIGVDMTDAMLEKARKNARTMGITNVEFRKGTIEDLPLEDSSVDTIISNCVINLSPEKDRVFGEAYRVLRSGGRLMISDLVLEHPLPSDIAEAAEAYVGCIGGASLREDYLQAIRNAGFRSVSVQREASFADAISLEDPQLREVMGTYDITVERVMDVLEGVRSLHILAAK
jgi:arsenite methyltransferase